MRNKTQPCFFDSSDGKFAADARILFQRLIQRVASFQIVNQDFERNAGSAKDRFSPENVHVFDDYIFGGSAHGDPPARNLIISSIHKNCSEKCKAAGMKLTLNQHPLKNQRVLHPPPLCAPSGDAKPKMNKKMRPVSSASSNSRSLVNHCCQLRVG